MENVPENKGRKDGPADKKRKDAPANKSGDLTIIPPEVRRENRVVPHGKQSVNSRAGTKHRRN